MTRTELRDRCVETGDRSRRASTLTRSTLANDATTERHSYCSTVTDDVEDILEFGCVALVDRASPTGARNCSRLARASVDFLRHGGQPLCHQHLDSLRDELQRVHLGLATLVAPNPDELNQLTGALRRCRALIAVGDDPAEDWTNCGHWTAWLQTRYRSPLAVPLCIGHAIALTYALRREWNRTADSPDRRRDPPGWGGPLAESYGLPRPRWDRY